MVVNFLFSFSFLVCVYANSTKLIRTTEIVGYKNGSFWSDENIYLKHGGITGIQTASNKTINGFRIRYGKYWGRWHGGTAGEIIVFDIENIVLIRGTHIHSIESSENQISSIEFTSLDGSRFGPFGHSSVKGKKYREHLKGCRLAYMSGYSGYANWLLKLKGIFFNWECNLEQEGSSIKVTDMIGAKASSFWSDEELYHKYGQISNLQIASGKSINAIRVRYGIKWGQWHGGTSGRVNSLEIKDISGVRGVEFKGNKTLNGHILSMEITALNGSRYGPYGNPTAKGYKYSKHLKGCHVAFVSGYSGSVGWLFRLTGIIFHWICDTNNTVDLHTLIQ